MRDAIAAGLPTIGICLGMQLLFARSEEGPGDGIGVIAGTVTRLAARRLPHIGWNSLDGVRDRALFSSKLTTVYYATASRVDLILPMTSSHGRRTRTDRFPAAIRRGASRPSVSPGEELVRRHCGAARGRERGDIMIAIPAIDVRDGCCVQLVGGSYDDERVRIADPLDAARRWREAGFRGLHVVDLDAATERGNKRHGRHSARVSDGYGRSSWRRRPQQRYPPKACWRGGETRRRRNAGARRWQMDRGPCALLA